MQDWQVADWAIGNLADPNPKLEPPGLYFRGDGGELRITRGRGKEKPKGGERRRKKEGKKRGNERNKKLGKRNQIDEQAQTKSGITITVPPSGSRIIMIAWKNTLDESLDNLNPSSPNRAV
jgi:hypothetical protein